MRNKLRRVRNKGPLPVPVPCHFCKKNIDDKDLADNSYIIFNEMAVKGAPIGAPHDYAHSNCWHNDQTRRLREQILELEAANRAGRASQPTVSVSGNNVFLTNCHVQFSREDIRWLSQQTNLAITSCVVNIEEPADVIDECVSFTGNMIRVRGSDHAEPSAVPDRGFEDL